MTSKIRAMTIPATMQRSSFLLHRPSYKQLFSSYQSLILCI
ncbi:hypothetical protein [Rickettsia endosymbiont of Polydrusus tereticollis]